MGRPKKKDIDEATTVRLLAAAERIFGAKGFGGARLEDIAIAAGIRRSSLLYHFGSKQTLYERVVEGAFLELHRRVVGFDEPKEGGFVEWLGLMTRSLLDFAEDRPGIPSLVLRELLETGEEGAGRRFFIALVDELEQRIREMGAGIFPADFPARDAIVALLMSRLTRAAMGERAVGIWSSGEDATTALILAMFMGASKRGEHNGCR